MHILMYYAMCLEINNIHTITANDLCTGELGTSSIWKGSYMNDPEEVTLPGKHSFCCQC
jgi:hypothetical protein